MIVRCLISYITPVGDNTDAQAFAAGELYNVDAEFGLWLLAAADGQFAVEETETEPDAALSEPPLHRQVSRPPRARRAGR